MAKPREPVTPRTFFLNEQHELAHGEKEAGGSLPKLAPLDWRARGDRIHDSLSTARETIRGSRDPLRANRYFLATVPAPTIKKHSKNLRRAPQGIVEEETDYAGEHSLVFRRLGLDLLAVDQEGHALVHAPASRVEQLLTTATALSEEGLREQARWVTIESFSPAPPSFRIDKEWVDTLSAKAPVDAVVELQPLLTRVEVEQVIHAILQALGARAERERFTRMGTDFSGRHWYRGMLSRESLRLISEQFFSVQALHPPLQTAVAVGSARKAPSRLSTPQPVPPPVVDPATLPAIAVVDVGVPPGHSLLARFRRGSYVSPDAPAGLVADHGSRVASRVVFGDPDFSAGVGQARPGCAFVDVNVAANSSNVDDKAVLTALQAIVATYPDVRVFNLSFGEFAPLGSHPAVERREKLLLLQDLDNFVFRSDVVVIVAAGNSRPGLLPASNYPDHVDDPQWALGSWACGFNTLKCGSYVGRLSPGGLVKNLGWPSPFTRIGPGGVCTAPVPEFSANGGNCTDQYQFAPGLGVWFCNAAGLWEDHVGTSLAAPLLAREVAFAIEDLQRRCEQGARPFGATVKAFLTLTADPTTAMPMNVQTLAERTLGRGTAKADRLRTPLPRSAVMIWQGILNGPQDKARVQVPIPKSWLREASHPLLRVIAAWESPVNQAVEHIWASRRVEVQLRPSATARALTPAGRNHPSYPLLDRRYDLGTALLEKAKVTLPEGDVWLLEVSYKEIADYAATIEFSPHQRVGIAMELADEGDEPVTPQAALQALPQALTMTRLTVPENRIPNPIIVRPRV
jgi:hypothetical protein